jgi:hypothetical protein
VTRLARGRRSKDQAPSTGFSPGARLLRSLRGIDELDEPDSWVQGCWIEPVMGTLTEVKAAVVKDRTGGATTVEAKIRDGLRGR